MVAVTVVRVFVGERTGSGNALAVVVDGGAVPEGSRQSMAADLAYSETVFVDDIASGRVRIFTPAFELPFAGHSLVGTAWLLSRLGHTLEVIRPSAGDVPTWASSDDVYWIRGRAEWAPEMEFVRMGSPQEVDALHGPPDGQGVAYCWAWIDEPAGVLRARAFAPAAGIPEDEATGAAAIRLTTELDRPIEIHQGRGSLLQARPGPEGTAEVGGKVVADSERQYQLPGPARVPR